MKGKKRWWDIRAQASADGGKVVEIRIYGDIGFWGTDADLFASKLDEVAATATSIVVAINSMGGDVFDAFTIYNALRRHAGKVTGRVDGVAASAASLILMACDTIVMPSNAMLMIHNPHTVAAGEAEDFRRLADLLDSTGANILAAYVQRSGLSDDDVRAMMNAETWLTASQAKEQGFCDSIEEPISIAAYAGAARLAARFSAVPAEIRAVLEDDGEVPPPNPQPNPPADPAPPPLATPDVTALASHVYAACRDARIEHCAEGIVLATGLRDRATVDAAIRSAQDIAGICLAASLTELTAGFVADGLTPDQVRARLFERVTASQQPVNGRPDPKSTPIPQASGRTVRSSDIYAARRVVNATSQR
ncbi:peptidase S14 [Burkholderia ubonensis]|uniref:head maturation protease, ClpP-related n=1 Tax=Burkholderia ubonensis TaxID=101571 RepID=UPI00075AC788|nr:head maturation protease, ClpP-related [Burkholderia ubonensis]KVC74667.1 peptidase S14 [Burkholderia ubonensis]KVG22985.1 peptidase S14 [Burkholderia ubonensis]OJA64774.1 peptidase S14 [Burkholderia ubonensis]